MSSETAISWLVIGFTAQALFSLRFLVQWVYSEKLRRSVVPVAFWYLSLAGGTGLLCYAIHRSDPVIITGQLFGVVVYGRNLCLIHGERRRAASSARGSVRQSASEARPAACCETRST